MIEFDQESCRDLNVALTREWLETNGIDGFSASTISGLSTCMKPVSVKFPKSSMETLRTHRAVAFAQAWSVAELLRAIVEDIEQPHREAAKGRLRSRSV
jgi:hypothetical protein